MIKRLFDLTLAACGLALLLPLFLIIALLIKFYDGGTVFYIQSRCGRGGRVFRMLKFRSMVVNAEALGAALTIGSDARITPLGKVLRRFKLDELPQLWNVFNGEMSLVGPRPEVAKYVDLYTNEQRQVLQLQPGVTDPASLAFFDESELLAQAADPERFYIEKVIDEKIRINLEYARKASLWTDCILILATLGRALGLRFDIFRWLKIEVPKFELAEKK